MAASDMPVPGPGELVTEDRLELVKPNMGFSGVGIPSISAEYPHTLILRTGN